MTKLPYGLKEFWREGCASKSPSLPLAAARILMGLFWSAEAFAPPLWPGYNLLCWLSAALLTLGLFTRVGAVLGLVLIGLRVVRSVNPRLEPLWPYGLWALIHVLILTTACGRSFGLDQLLMEKLANWPARRQSWLRKMLSFML